MCWNADVSLNTFLFSGFVLLLIMYNNQYTKYKIQEFNNKWMYVFIASFIFMQLIEYFIWKNINNPYYNNIFSICATILLLFQPIASLMLLSNIQLRNILLMLYLSLSIPFSIYKFSTNHISSSISQNGHLRWNFFKNTFPQLMCWMVFFLFSPFYEKLWVPLIFGISTFIISFINYQKEDTYTSMWCWVANFLMIYYAMYLLIYLPFLENKSIC
jgi:hypothetical protein